MGILTATEVVPSKSSMIEMYAQNPFKVVSEFKLNILFRFDLDFFVFS